MEKITVLFLMALCSALLGCKQEQEKNAIEGVKNVKLPFASENEEGRKKCEAFNTSEKEYYYGEAELLSFAQAVPPAHTPKKYDKPLSWWAIFKSTTNEKVRVGIPGQWQDLSVPEYKLKLMALPIPMKPRKIYSFCYEPAQSGSLEYFRIAYPETIQLIEE